MKTAGPFRLAAPFLLLCAACVYYVGVVRPARLRNEERREKISRFVDRSLRHLETKGLYPTDRLLQGLQAERMRWERGLEKAFLPRPQDPNLEMERKYLFEKWGFAPSDPLFKEVERFRASVAEALGPGGKEQAESLARQLALSLLSADVERVERLTCIATPWDRLPQEGFLRSFEVDIVLSAGVDQLMQVLESWVLHTGGGVVVIPDTIRMRREDPNRPGSGTGPASSPLVRMECRTRVVYLGDK